VNVLRPPAAEAEAAWHDLVVAEREQVEGLPDRPRAEDFYAPIAQAFKADPHRSDEPLLDVLRTLVRPDETWIDIGAGGGRYTLPIALLARRVYAVEPSAGMRAALAEAARENAIDNVDVFDERWPGPSSAPAADTALISHVGYDIADIGPFLDEMEAHASRKCVAVLFHRAPLSDFAALWAPVHGEERVQLPAMGELMTLLFARGATPELRFLDLPPPFAGRYGCWRAAKRTCAWPGQCAIWQSPSMVVTCSTAPRGGWASRRGILGPARRPAPALLQT
jgi:hypothetical protein